MTDRELLMYEMPWYAERCSIGFIQEIIARMCAHKVNRKLKRLHYRIARDKIMNLIK
jgi:hypothetical protein